MRLLHFADLHLDSQFAWAGREAAGRWRQRLRDALRAIARLARERRVDAVLCAGDLYEHDRVTPDTAAFVRDTFASLAPIRVFVAPGNHDFVGRGSLFCRGDWSANVHIFREARLEPVPLAEGVTLFGAAHRGPANTDGFLDGFRADRGGVRLALFHGAERGSLAAQGGEKQPHAPFAAVDLDRAGLHHAFVGHYHVPRDAERYTYPGNPDALAFGEGGARGAVIATVGRDGSVARERVRVGTTELYDLALDVTGCTSQQAVRDRIATALAGRTGLARVTLAGEVSSDTEIRPQELVDAAPDLEAARVRIGDLRVAYAFDEIAEERTVRGEFVRAVRAAADLDEVERRRILVAGLRTFEGREDPGLA